MATMNTNKSTTTKEQPKHKVRVGNVTLTAWENKLDDGREILNTTIAKSYKDAKGNWQETNSFDKHALQNLRIALDKMLEYQYIEYPASKKQQDE